MKTVASAFDFKKRLKWNKLFLAFLLLVSVRTVSQVYYSVNPKYLQVKTENNNLLSRFNYQYPDSTVSELSNFFPRNFLGNIGLASPSYMLNYGTPDLGFILFQPPVMQDRFQQSDVGYYRSIGPFANLTGIAGSKQLQIFKMLFTHTYKDKVNITLRFNRYTSQGFYKRQQTFINNFYLSSNYETRSKRLGYYFYVLNNNNKNNENGGLAAGRLTDTSVLLPKDILPVYLSNAYRSNKEFLVQINPYFRLNKWSDSTHLLDHYLQIKSKFHDQSFLYTENEQTTQSGFYKTINYDSTFTKDSAHVRQFTNSLEYSVLTSDRKFGLSVGFKNEISLLWQRSDSLLMNNIVFADLMFRPSQKSKDSLRSNSYFENHVNVQQVLDGVNAGNFKAEATSQILISARSNLKSSLRLLFENRNPDWIFNEWYSNHFIWSGLNLVKQQQIQASAGISVLSKISLDVFYQSVKNYLYFGFDALPAQYNGAINNSGISLTYGDILFRHLGIYAKHTYQSTTRPQYVRIPGNVTTARLFYNGNLFNNNLQLQIGSQIQIYEDFRPYGYMPATQTFYLQDNVATGAYPYLDVYLNARIKPVSFFLKVENILQDLAGKKYFLVPGYYQPERAFRFGLTWLFFD